MLGRDVHGVALKLWDRSSQVKGSQEGDNSKELEVKVESPLGS